MTNGQIIRNNSTQQGQVPEQSFNAADREAIFQMGRVIGNWAQVEDYVFRQIGSLQSLMGHRARRMPRSLYPDTPMGWESSEILTIEDPEKRWKEKWKQFSRLCCKLHPDKALEERLGQVSSRLTALYSIRNTVAHAVGMLQATEAGDTYGFTSSEWDYAFWAELEKSPGHRKTVVKEKAYTITQLTDWADELWRIWWDLRGLVSLIPETDPPLKT